MLQHHDERSYSAAASEAARRARAKLHSLIDEGLQRAGQVIQAVQDQQPVDRLVRGAAISFEPADGALSISAGDQSAALHPHALRQAASRVGLPWTYARHLLHPERGVWGRSLLAHNLNRLYAAHPQDSRFLLRAVHGEVRGFLSDRFRRLVSSPMLLTGLLECGKCGAAMTLETGRSGRFRYYNCRRRLREGTQTCDGTRIRAEHLEHSLLGHIQYELFKPDRVRKMLQGLAQSMAGLTDELHQQRKGLDAERRGLEGRLLRQFEAIESEVVTKDDVGERVRELKARLVEVDKQLLKLAQPNALPAIPMDSAAVERFTDQLEDLFMSEDRTFARHYLQLLLDKVVVDGKVVHVHARAQGVAQMAVTKKDEADEALPSSAPVPTSVMSMLRQTDSNCRPSG